MLTESFVASIGRAERAPVNAPHKDAGVFFHEYQPLPALKSVFKKSNSRPNGFAVSATHVFAAQADKAVVNVYNIERGNQEAIVPFPEKISSLALIGDPEDAGILALGNEAGRVILWELCTGRQVSTPAAHLQAIECMAVDPTYNFLLTGSADSTIHAWSIATLLSFSSNTSCDPKQPSQYSPLRTLSKHRGAITCLVTGHSHSSMNIAITGSKDNTCIVWDYQAGTLLHTFLLASAPLCIALDPADRALYVGLEDGSIQLVDFYKKPAIEHPVHDPKLSNSPTQPPQSDRWTNALESSPALSIAVSYDGTALVSGHENGKIQQWDTATGRSSGEILSDLFAPVTNIRMLPIKGFHRTRKIRSKAVNIIKPKYESSFGSGNASSAAGVPENYTFNSRFASMLPLPRFIKSSQNGRSSEEVESLMEDFEAALMHPSFPDDLIGESLAALSAPLSSEEETPRYFRGWKDDIRMDFIAVQREAERSRESIFEYIAVCEELSLEVKRLRNLDSARKRRMRMKRIRRANFEERERMKAMGEPVLDVGDDDDNDMDEDKEEHSDETSEDELTGSE